MSAVARELSRILAARHGGRWEPELDRSPTLARGREVGSVTGSADEDSLRHGSARSDEHTLEGSRK